MERDKAKSRTEAGTAPRPERTVDGASRSRLSRSGTDRAASSVRLLPPWRGL